MLKIVKLFIYSCGLFLGLLVFAIFRRTPNFGYQSMVYMFCLTRGRSNDLISYCIGLIRPPQNFPTIFGLLKEEIHEAVDNLNNKGYYVFKSRLSKEVCNSLLEFALTQRCEGRSIDGFPMSETSNLFYPRNSPNHVRYDFLTEDLLGNQNIQKLMADLSFAEVAQRYIGSTPILDIVAMWWHSAYLDKPDMQAAQYYHFDMDRPKWLKFFIYLTDVTPDSGPHTFVEGSHKSGAIPEKLLNKGYTRLSDAEIKMYFPSQDKEFVGPCGTIIAEDTRGLHKGKHVISGDRLVLQFEYCNSLFGSSFLKVKIPKVLHSDLKATLKSNPSIYTLYL